MSESSLVEREAAALKTLERIAVERARAETETEQGFRVRVEKEELGFRQALHKVTKTAQTEIATTEARYQSVRGELVAKFSAERQAAEKEHADALAKTAARTKTALKVAKREQDEARWQVLAVFEAAKDSTVKRNKQRESELHVAKETFQTLKDEAEHLLEASRKFIPPHSPAPAEAPAAAVIPVETAAVTVPGDAAAVVPDETAAAVVPAEPPAAVVPAEPPAAVVDEPFVPFQDHIKLAEERLVPLTKLWLPKFLKPQQFVWPFVVLGLVLAYPLWMVLGLTIGPVVDGVLVIAAGVGVWFWLAKIARGQVAEHYPLFRQTLDEADALALRCDAWIKSSFEKHKADIEQTRAVDTQKSADKLARVKDEVERRRDQETAETEAKLPVLLKDIEQKRVEALQQVDERYPKRLADLKEKLEQDTKQLKDNFRAQKETTQQEYRTAWQALIEKWRSGLADVGAQVDGVNQECERFFLDWSQGLPPEWVSPAAAPPALRFGEFAIDRSQIPQGITTDDRLKSIGPNKFSFPSLIPFPSQGSLLLKVGDSGKAEAAQVLQAMMLRYLTSIPPGKVRYTIIDPVGLGEHYAAFMHLGDYHELLVNSRIWTEPSHIEQRLADIQAHMENVIQKYLRNEFNTIEEYNVHAGEVAEPFRVVVVANFPVNFNDSAARRLLSIASSGARCGVYTLISVDTKQQIPTGCPLKELEQFSLNLLWKDGRFQWKESEFSRFPLKLDPPPEPETFSKLLHTVGERARDANRVEVPFEFIAPTPDQFWTFSTAKGVDVPLGRAGATKLQHLKLGRGTAQHVLIAGKTGSGKSTMLHALIVNAALRYSPDELSLYLIDFKKGVEFKVYAAFKMPHARVIAVESEREFGLSVLQRLDLELKVRGDLFRDLGVQDLGGYRGLENQPPLPRILLLVDEFQEFFVEDDKIAQDTSLLLDRLVRQGRAFGIHVHLGSQTLGGAFSLARSTLGQMAVRIALQCSEADGHLILSEDNSAARLLTRPGEAIYNDANGLVEGNNFFQVVWLSDTRREEYLRIMQDMAVAQGRPPVDQIVFEGNLPAVPSRNHLLGGLLNAGAWPEPPKADFAWLGEAIAIKDPTSAVFRPQSGSNLLMVGQTDTGALGMFATTLVSFAAQHAPPDPARPGTGVRFYLFDGTPADSRNAGILAGLASVLPHPVKDVSWRDLPAALAELAAEVERRQSDPAEAPPIYVFVYDLQRFRDLRKADDDFGYSKYGEEKVTPPSKLFVNLLREGPQVGVHALVWCDSLNNLNRSFDRQALREFEIRVLFQMSANDSSALIDSPAAGKIGPMRALFFSEEEGRLEKFRPYGVPEDDWMAWVGRQFRDRQTLVDASAEPANPFPATESAEAAEA